MRPVHKYHGCGKSVSDRLTMRSPLLFYSVWNCGEIQLLIHFLQS
ncbi:MULTISPECIES: hypothetical protein [unclassified Anabaena]